MVVGAELASRRLAVIIVHHCKTGANHRPTAVAEEAMPEATSSTARRVRDGNARLEIILVPIVEIPFAITAGKVKREWLNIRRSRFGAGDSVLKVLLSGDVCDDAEAVRLLYCTA